MRAYIALLRERPQLRWLWLAMSVSLLGDWFNTIATVILVNRYTDSGLAVSALFLARGLPPFLIGPLAGVIADRFNRKMILVTSDLLRAGIVLGFLLVTSSGMAWLIYVLTAAQFVVSAFFEPARAAILPSLVDEGELLIANTLTNATWSAVLAFGAAIGGLVAAQFGVHIALVIDAFSFLLSAFFSLQIVPVFRAAREAAKHASSGWHDLVDGFRYVKRNPNIGVFTLVKGAGQVGAVDIMFALYADHIFVVGKEGAITLGVLYTCFGIGAVLGPMIGNTLGDGSERFLRRWIFIGFLMLPVGWLGFSFASFLAIAAIASLIRGMGGSINWTYSSVLLQLKTPDQYLGRVFALDFSIFTLAYALSVLVTGFLSDRLNIAPRELALVASVGGILSIVFWWAILRIPSTRAETVNTSIVQEEPLA